MWAFLLYLGALFWVPLPAQSQGDSASKDALGAAAAEASSEPTAFLGLRISEIVFQGLVNVRNRDLRIIRDNNIAQKLSDAIISNIIVDTFNLEYFANVQLRYQKIAANAVRIFVVVTEKKLVWSIRFQGRSSLMSRGKLTDVIPLQERDSYLDEGQLRTSEQNIQTAYSQKGALNTVVRSFVEPDPKRPNAVIVNFIINEGERLRIAGVDFVGSNYSKARLFRALGPGNKPLNYKRDILFFPKDYVAGEIADDRQIYESFYRSEGYLDMRITRVEEVLFRVSRIKLKVSKAKLAQTRFLKLVFYIDEGPQYTYDGIRLSGNQLFSSQELESLFGLKPGQPFNLTQFHASLAAIQEKYVSLGYLQTQVIPLAEKDAAKRTVSYQIKIVESKVRNRVESIEIQGNTVTKDYVILREIPLQPGDIFNSAELRRGIQNLLYTRYFESVEPDFVEGSEPGLVRIIVKVTEGQTINVNAGLRITPSAVEGNFPISGTFQLSENNFLGRGYSLGTSLELGVSSQSVQLQFGNPRIFGSNFGAGLFLAFNHNLSAGIGQDLDGNGVLDPFLSQSDYEKASAVLISQYLADFGMRRETSSIRLGANSKLEWRIPIFNQYSRLGLSNSYSTSLSYVDYENDVFRPLEKRTRQNFQTWLFSDTLNFGLNWNTIDIPIEPNRGVAIGQYFTLGGLIPSAENIYYLQSRSSLDIYVPIVEARATQSNYIFRLIFHFGSSFHILLRHPWKEVIPDAQRYGTQLVRYTTINRGSWSYDYGRVFWSNTVEIRYPVIPQVLSIDLFFDAIMLWRELEQIRNTKLDDFRFTLGLGPRLTIPQLPLAIYVTKNFRFRNGTLDGDPEPGSFVMTNGWAFSFVFNIPF